MSTRHRDTGAWLARFAGLILVVCPKCGGRASVVPRPGLDAARYAGELMFLPRRLSCAGCGATASWEAQMKGAGLVAATLGGTEEPFFGRPLWLQTRCAGHVLWAYNEEHIAELTAYVSARLRENSTTSPTRAMIPRLPTWLKSARNRDEVLAALDRLRTLAGRSTPENRSATAHEHGDHPRPYDALYFRGGPYEA